MIPDRVFTKPPWNSLLCIMQGSSCFVWNGLLTENFWCLDGSTPILGCCKSFLSPHSNSNDTSLFLIAKPVAIGFAFAPFKAQFLSSGLYVAAIHAFCSEQNFKQSFGDWMLSKVDMDGFKNSFFKYEQYNRPCKDLWTDLDEIKSLILALSCKSNSSRVLSWSFITTSLLHSKSYETILYTFA